MKLIVAIVQDEDAGRLVSALMDKGFGVTKLATTGGFLRAGNTTLISGVEDERLDEALGIVEKICKSREQITASAAPMNGFKPKYAPTATPTASSANTICRSDKPNRMLS